MTDESRIASTLKTSRDALALVRDLAVLAAVLILVVAPERMVPTFQDVGLALADAGFTKFSIGGAEQDLTRLKEKMQEARLDTQLAQEEISQLSRQLALDQELSPEARQQLDYAAELVGKSYDTLAGAGPVQPAQAPAAVARSDRKPSWVIVIGADRDLGRAEDEVRRAAKAGFSGAFIIRRETWYRTAIPMASRATAEEQLPAVAKAIRDGSYIRDLSAWCATLESSADKRFRDCTGA